MKDCGAMSSKPKLAAQETKRIDPDALKAYAASGYQLIPLHCWNDESKDRSGNPRKDGKRPLHSNWTARPYGSAKVAAVCVKQNRNVGVRLRDSELVVDIDPRNGGNEGFANLCADKGLEPCAWPRVETGSAGSHFYLTLPEGVRVVDTLAHEDDKPGEPPRYRGVEFKSRGRQVVAAGSVHPNGNPYFWDSIDHPPLADAPEAPAVLVDAIRRPEASEKVGGGQATPEQIARALEGLDVTDFREESKWRALMMACHHASNGDARSEFIERSTQDPNYSNDADIIGRRWDSLHRKKAGGITFKTLNKFLSDAGESDRQIPDKASDDFPAVTDEETQSEEEPEDECSEGGFRVGGLDFTFGNTIKSEAIEWLWDQRFPVGMLSMIVGFPEMGKSQICCSIVARVAKGAKWPNDEGHAPKGAALILSAEDSPSQTLKPRLVAAGADMGQVIVTGMTVRTEGGRRMMNLADDLKRLSAGVDMARKSGREVKVVIIDPISAYMGGKSKGNTWNQTDVRAILAPVAEWAQRERVAVIALSHFNKAGNSHLLYRVSDSIGFTAAARAVWYCVADKDDEGRKLFLKGKGSVARADVPGFSYRIASKPLTLDDGKIRDAPFIQWGETVNISAEAAMAERKEESPALAAAVVFLRSLLAKGPMLLKEIREHVNASEHSPRTIKRAKSELNILSSKEGFADGEWRWSLPEPEEDEDFG
jgi:hypothetical protein